MLRARNAIAAHLLERRMELDLTQQEVAAAAGTSHSAVSRLERGHFLPKLRTLRRIAAVLDEELVIGFRHYDDGEMEEEISVVPELALAG